MYLLIFLVLIITGITISYILFIREKREELKLIQDRVCPKCGRESIELIDQRGGGCSSAKMVTFECRECRYSSIFNLSSSCRDGGCSI
ncbi:MAG: hypothetical protein GXO06_06195 [Epsilonproteobacteria bacterium]|nr:hypothetical protein [Campylobacterota bacterium]